MENGSSAPLTTFAAASGLNVVEVKGERGELSCDRVVNATMKGAQHGVRVGVGELVGDSNLRGGSQKTLCTLWPATAGRVTAPRHAVEIRCLPGAVDALQLTHELGHALGAHHHGYSDAPGAGEEWVKLGVAPDGKTRIEVYDERVRRLDPNADRPISYFNPATNKPEPSWKVQFVARRGGPPSGDLNCPMAYRDYLFALHEDLASQPPVRRYYLTPEWTKPTAPKFCSSAAGTGINAKQQASGFSYFGDAGENNSSTLNAGNCLSQMHVRDSDAPPPKEAGKVDPAAEAVFFKLAARKRCN